MEPRCEAFGTLEDGRDVSRYTLENDRGSIARWIDLGAALTELWLPDRNDTLADVVLGYDDVAGYLGGGNFGCTVGRVANRIAGASFELDGTRYELAANDGPNHLHGGRVGFDKQLWTVDRQDDPHGPALRFSLTSPDGDEGYPGRLEVAVTVVLGHDDALRFEYEARCDAPTPINLTHHSYWNLAGRGGVLEHELCLRAERYTEVDPALIPTGRLLPVDGTALDFRVAKTVGRDLEGVPGGGGYDHNFVLADAARSTPREIGWLRDPGSGRRLRLSTTEPGVQLYTANSLDARGKGGSAYGPHAGLCLETQHFPDALHHESFPGIVLRPGETYRQETIYAFDCPAGEPTP